MYLTAHPAASGENLGEVLEALGLGVALFQTGQSILTSGAFSSNSSTVSYVHERTPPSQTFRRCVREFSFVAFHPRPIIGHIVGDQNFWFRLEFDYNGNDVRNAGVRALVDRSSTLTTSSFTATFEGREYSVRTDPVAEVVFLISGQWDPWGRGYVSFEGKLYVKADGSVRLTDFRSERNWVWVGTRPAGCERVAPAPPPVPPRDIVLPIPFVVYFSPPGSDRLREGDEQRLARWILGLAPPLRQSLEQGRSPIRVDGYASTTQPAPANRDLSRRRAERVARLLRDLLGPGARLEVRAFGEHLARTPDRVENPRERRVIITLLSTVRLPGTGGVQGYGLDGLPCLYGRWCGPGCSGPGAPIDALDTCCQTHDQCYSRRGYFNCGCDRALLDCIAPLRDPGTPMGRWASRVHRYFSLAPCRR